MKIWLERGKDKIIEMIVAKMHSGYRQNLGSASDQEALNFPDEKTCMQPPVNEKKKAFS